jgi:SAM-dependent methyltransferase
MLEFVTPRRIRGHEILDEEGLDPELVVRSMRDVVRANFVFGGARCALAELKPWLRNSGPRLTLLDVGTGIGDIPAGARKYADKFRVSLRGVGLDPAEELLRAARANLSDAVCGDGMQLPFRDRSIDVVMCSQVLHHFTEPDGMRLLSEMNRVARKCVVVSDLRRSWLAVAGFWATSFALRFHPVSRHDGIVSIRRGFTRNDLANIVQAAVGTRPRVTRRIWFRVTTSWVRA